MAAQCNAGHHYFKGFHQQINKSSGIIRGKKAISKPRLQFLICTTLAKFCPYLTTIWIKEILRTDFNKPTVGRVGGKRWRPVVKPDFTFPPGWLKSAVVLVGEELSSEYCTQSTHNQGGRTVVLLREQLSAHNKQIPQPPTSPTKFVLWFFYSPLQIM